MFKCEALILLFLNNLEFGKTNTFFLIPLGFLENPWLVMLRNISGSSSICLLWGLFIMIMLKHNIDYLVGRNIPTLGNCSEMR